MGYIADNFRKAVAPEDARAAGAPVASAVPRKAPAVSCAARNISDAGIEAAAVVFRGHMHKRCAQVLLFKQLKPRDQERALADMREAIRAYLRVAARER